MTAYNVSPVADLRNDGLIRHALRDGDAIAGVVTAPLPAEPAEPDAQPTPVPLSAPAPEPTKPELPRATGPTARRVTLPQPREGLATTPTGVDEHLSLLEAARQAQLDALPQIPPGDGVAAAHRGTVTRILEQVRAARRRLSDGVYGICAGCGTAIHPERLELRPWLITCTGCASPDRP